MDCGVNQESSIRCSGAFLCVSGRKTVGQNGNQSLPATRWGLLLHVNYIQGQGLLMPCIDCQVYRVTAWFLELYSVYAEDHVGRDRKEVWGESDSDAAINIWADGFTVFIDNADAYAMIALLDTVESDSKCNGAVWVCNRKLLHHDLIECPQQTEFPAIVSRGVT